MGVLSLNAQTFGVKAGMNYNNWRDSDNISDMVDPLLGFQAGAFVNFKLSDKISLQSELLYTAKGVKYAPSTNIKYKYGYLDIPIMAQYHFNEAFSVNFGPELSFLTKAIITDGTDEADFKDESESFVYGLNLGISYELPMGLIFDARYAYGLSGVLIESPDVLNSALQLTVGYVIPFNKK